VRRCLYLRMVCVGSEAAPFAKAAGPRWRPRSGKTNRRPRLAGAPYPMPEDAQAVELLRQQAQEKFVILWRAAVGAIRIHPIRFHRITCSLAAIRCATAQCQSDG